MTAKTDTRSPIIVELYRNTGENSGGTFYKVTSDQTPLTSSVDVDTVSFVDSASDASITSNEIIYTQGQFQGGPLPYAPPPGGSIAATSNGRVFVAGMEDSLMFSFSHKQNMIGHGTEFNDNFRTRIDLPGFNEITAIGALDDKTVFFSRGQICYIYGDGPDRLGNGTFSPPTLIASSVRMH